LVVRASRLRPRAQGGLQVTEVPSYTFPKPGTLSPTFEKVSFVTKVGDLGLWGRLLQLDRSESNDFVGWQPSRRPLTMTRSASAQRVFLSTPIMHALSIGALWPLAWIALRQTEPVSRLAFGCVIITSVQRRRRGRAKFFKATARGHTQAAGSAHHRSGVVPCRCYSHNYWRRRTCHGWGA
jgi:hypothetical protein